MYDLLLRQYEIEYGRADSSWVKDEEISKKICCYISYVSGAFHIQRLRYAFCGW